jgi:hypothetical protein
MRSRRWEGVLGSQVENGEKDREEQKKKVRRDEIKSQTERRWARVIILLSFLGSCSRWAVSSSMKEGMTV